MRPRAVIENNVIQIKFLNKNGSLSDITLEIDIIPVIELSIGQDATEGVCHSRENGKPLALIDTGADHFVIDSAFAETANFFPEKEKASPAGVNGVVEDSNVYHLAYKIEIAGGVKVMAAAFVAMPITKFSTRKYQAILGMTFIKKGRLIMDSKTNQYLFEFNSIN